MHAGGERRVQGAAAALLLALLLAPPLAAAADSATFTTDSVLQLPADSALQMAPDAIYMNGTSDLAALSLTAPRVLVEWARHEAPEVGVADVSIAGPSGKSAPRFTLTNVVLTLVPGGANGYVGVYPHAGAAAGVVTAGDLTLVPQAALQVGGVVDQGPDGAPGQAGYGRTLTGPVLDVRADGTLTYTGPGVVKLNGPAVLLAADENTTRIETGRRVTGEAPLRRVNEFWLVLTFEQATLTVQHPRMQIATEQAALNWDGTAVVAAMRGELQAQDGRYVAEGQSANLAGTFQGVARAQSAADGRAITAVHLEGELASTSLSPASRASIPVPAWRPFGLGVLVAAVVAVSVSGALLYRRRRAPEEDLTVEQYRDLADAAMENLRFADALEWLEKAQAIAPASARLWMDKGYCHASLGDVPDALAAYERAAQLSQDGEADLLAASLLLRAGQPDLDAAERHVERALERSPAMALEVHLDNVFDPLRGRPRFSRLLRRSLGERDE
ncbi:MAG TPA: tetratricopeptide repeat protein [Candidatus Thermoplasmatota archaeon]|nr:tetratricopeptide repeat protein [Candidatus Thermoplasmatota archaeon]